MNNAIRTFQPSSSWITAALLTVFVVAFGIFASAHARSEPHYAEGARSLTLEVSHVQGTNHNRGIFRYH